jgi:hypothetical protein
MKRRPRARTVFARAAEPIWATVRSTTLVYSSNTTSGAAAASSRASVTRNCWPVDSTWNGRSHAGGDEKPTADSSAITSLTGKPSGKPSRTERSRGQVRAAASAVSLGHSARAIVDLPQPLGPTIRPMCQSFSCSGSRTVHSSREDFSGGKSKMPRICRTRAVSTTGDSTTMWAGGVTRSSPGMSVPRFGSAPAARAGSARRYR